MREYSDLAVLMAVAREGSMTRAAKHLGVPLSTVSRRIDELEKSVSRPLLTRDTRSMSLTSEGRYLFQSLDQAYLRIEHTLADIRDNVSSTSRTIRITAPSFFGTAILSDWLFHFEQENPSVHFEIDLSNRSRNIVSDGYDLALRVGKLKDSTLQTRRLCGAELELCCGPGYFSLKGGNMTQETLPQHAFLLHSKRDEFVELRDVMSGSSFRFSPHTVYKSGSIEFIEKCVLANRGLALLPRFQVRRLATRGELISLRHLFELTNQRSIHLVYPKQQVRSPVVARLIEYLVVAGRALDELGP